MGIASRLQDYTDRVYLGSVSQRTLSVDEGATSFYCNLFRVLRVIAEIDRLPSAPDPRSLIVSAGLTRIYPTRVNPTYCCLLVEVLRDLHKAGDWPPQSSILPTGFSISADPAVTGPKPLPYQIGGSFTILVETSSRFCKVNLCLAFLGIPRSLIVNCTVWYYQINLFSFLTVTFSFRVLDYYSLTVIPYKEDR